jgi:hypothetical protein
MGKDATNTGSSIEIVRFRAEPALHGHVSMSEHPAAGGVLSATTAMIREPKAGEGND